MVLSHLKNSSVKPLHNKGSSWKNVTIVTALAAALYGGFYLNKKHQKFEETQKLEYMIQPLKGNLNVFQLEFLKKQIQQAESNNLDVTRYKEELPSLEKQAYINELVFSLLYQENAISTASFQKNLKKIFALGVANDDINAQLIAFIEQELQGMQFSYKNFLKYAWDKELSQIEKNHLKSLSESISFLTAKRNEVKAHPIDFGKILAEAEACVAQE